MPGHYTTPFHFRPNTGFAPVHTRASRDRAIASDLYAEMCRSKSNCVGTESVRALLAYVQVLACEQEIYEGREIARELHAPDEAVHWKFAPASGRRALVIDHPQIPTQSFDLAAGLQQTVAPSQVGGLARPVKAVELPQLGDSIREGAHEVEKIVEEREAGRGVAPTRLSPFHADGRSEGDEQGFGRVGGRDVCGEAYEVARDGTRECVVLKEGSAACEKVAHRSEAEARTAARIVGQAALAEEPEGVDGIPEAFAHGAEGDQREGCARTVDASDVRFVRGYYERGGKVSLSSERTPLRRVLEQFAVGFEERQVFDARCGFNLVVAVRSAAQHLSQSLPQTAAQLRAPHAATPAGFEELDFKL